MYLLIENTFVSAAMMIYSTAPPVAVKAKMTKVCKNAYFLILCY